MTSAIGFVYAIGPLGGPLNIGCSREPWVRRDSLQTGHPARLIVQATFAFQAQAASAVTSTAHRLLEQRRHHGDWFETSLDEAIEAVDQAARELAVRSAQSWVRPEDEMSGPEIINLPTAPIDLAEIGKQAAEFARRARAANTKRAYRADWAHFEQWCTAAGLVALPAQPPTIGAYLTSFAGQLKVATLSRRLAALRGAHRLAGHGLDLKHPAIANVLAGIRRTYGSRQDRKTAILTEDLRRMVRALPATPIGVRDKAVLLVGFAGAFRRSELVALDRDDVAISNAGLTISIGHSKTDQEGRGREIGIPRSKRSATCPVAALEAWLELRAIKATGQTDGQTDRPRVPLFTAISKQGRGARLSGRAVAEIVKQAVSRVRLDPAKYSGHSLRSGFCTSAARGGADLASIMEQSGHASADMARRYVQRGTLLQNPASKAVRL